jgi:predicted ATPase with chaperone activity
VPQLSPGEASLAHGGVLYLDDVEEFSRGAMEALAAVFEKGASVVHRAGEATRLPARFHLVASTGFPDRAARVSSGIPFRIVEVG